MRLSPIEKENPIPFTVLFGETKILLAAKGLGPKPQTLGRE